MKKLLSAFICIFLFSGSSFALVEIDITRGNLEPLPIAVSPLYLEPGSKEIKHQIGTKFICNDCVNNIKDL